MQAAPCPLRVVDALALDEAYRSALRPDEVVEVPGGRELRLPRWFYEVPSAEVAATTRVSARFRLGELMAVDVRESAALRGYPRFVPCTVALLAAHLELFRQAAGAPVWIAVNGGYRSPSHALSTTPSPHWWGAAANVYRVGNEWLHDRERIERYNELARSAVPGVWTRPYGELPGCVFDHVHLDLGYVTVAPHPSAEGEAP